MSVLPCPFHDPAADQVDVVVGERDIGGHGPLSLLAFAALAADHLHELRLAGLTGDDELLFEEALVALVDRVEANPRMGRTAPT